MRRFLLVALVISLPAARAIAQADAARQQDPNLNRSLEPAPRIINGRGVGNQGAPPEPKVAWGDQWGETFLAASQFTLKNNSTNPDLDYASFHFYSGSGRYFAQLAVEPGMSILQVRCYYNDSHPLDDIQFQWQRYTTDLSTGTTSTVVMDSFETTDNPGIGFHGLGPPVGQEVFQVRDGVVNPVNHYIAVDLTPNVSFLGCVAYWRRTVTPAPMTATFSDVPTSHPYFRFVEALAEAGIAAGCGGGLYCVNSPITRGEMAVLLAFALGVGTSAF